MARTDIEGGSLEGVNGTENRIGVESAPTIVDVDVGNESRRGRRPERLKTSSNKKLIPVVIEQSSIYLKEAEERAGSGRVGCRACGVTLSGGECSTFTQSAMLNGDGEERRSVDLFPKIVSGVVPVGSYEVEVDLDLRPKCAGRIRGVAF